MMMNRVTTPEVENDGALVERSLTGDRDAFGRIVARYQSLVCSLAYSATGNVAHSEDLAQETFVTAWKRLGDLSEPRKLRPWLCGIARNLIGKWLRDSGREPTRGALEIEEDLTAPELPPPDHLISQEEQGILWRAVERVPEVYREPLVLFYREGRSVEKVAEALELSEDAVKQRLSRGRKLLQEELHAFVEGALERTAPGRAFTLGVLAALPAFTVSATAAAAGATAVQGSASAKTAAGAGLFGALAGPLLAVAGTWMGYRMGMDAARSGREAKFVRSFYKRLGLTLGLFFAAFAVLMFGAGDLIEHHPALFVWIIVGLAGTYIAAIIALTVWSSRERKALLAQVGPEAARQDRPSWGYKSQASFLGLPLVHIKIGGGVAAQWGPVKGWIAAGDTAVGGLFAFGGVAVAPFSMGGVAIGLLPFGGFAAGVLALGGLSLGVWSFGGLGLGWQAFAGCAVAWDAAVGGVAIAREFALGGLARALIANNQEAARHISACWFFVWAKQTSAVLPWLHLLWAGPLFAWWRATARNKTRLEQAAG